jgi:hypothetical protein
VTSPLRSTPRDLRLTAAAAVVCAALVLALPDGVARVLAGVVLALVCPGYALTAAAFARHPQEPGVRVVLTLALSIAVLGLGSIIGHVTPGGLTTTGWVVELLVVVLAACLVAVRRAPAGGEPAPVAWRLPRVRAVDAVLVSLAIVVAGGGVVLARTTLPADDVVGYTQLWMVPASGQDASILRIGVRSAETSPQAYRLEVRVGRRTRVIRSRLVLAPGRVFEHAVSVHPRRRGTAVTARLFRLDHPDVVYRRATAEVRPS